MSATAMMFSGRGALGAHRLESKTALKKESKRKPRTLSGDELYRLGLDASAGADGAGLDLVTAHQWFNLAAMRGNEEARMYRAELAREMSQADIAEAQRRAREWLKEQADRA